MSEPQQPEAMQILRRLRRLSIPYWGGGYADQPYILTLEFDTVAQAEYEHQRLIDAQNRLKLERANVEKS